jgi:hypothetical protein
LFIQKQAKIFDIFDNETITSAEKNYSKWFLSELTNEISPVIKEHILLYKILKNCGRKHYYFSDFAKTYKKYSGVKVGMNPKEILSLLYELGVIYNIYFVNNKTYMSSSIVNEDSIFDEEKKILLHTGIGSALLRL